MAQEQKLSFSRRILCVLLGGALALIVQRLPSNLVSGVLAEDAGRSLQYDTVACRSLRVVDPAGKTWTRLELVPNSEGNADVIQIHNNSGTAVFSMGIDPGGGFFSVADSKGEERAWGGSGRQGGWFSIKGNDSKERAAMYIGQSGGNIGVGTGNDQYHAQMLVNDRGGVAYVTDGSLINVQMEIFDNAGYIGIYGKNGRRRADISTLSTGGAVEVLDSTGTARRGILYGASRGGTVQVLGNKGKAVSMFTGKNGGIVNIYDSGAKGRASLGITSAGGRIRLDDGQGQQIARIPR